MKTMLKVLLTAGVASMLLAQNDDVVLRQKKLEAAADAMKANVIFNKQTFNFVSGQLVSGPPVKGAPYSAEAVNETVQTLADGNRIVQRTSAMQYRDSEGRERREETSAMGAIFITDPVAGARYTLHPESQTAEKGPLAIFKIAPSISGNVFAYSSSEPVALNGTVTEMQWVNPTAWIVLAVKGLDGGTTNWKCATSGPNALLKLDWTRNSIKTGDVVTIKGLRANGENTCVANSVELPNGTTLAARAEPPSGLVSTIGPVTVATGRSGEPGTFTVATAGPGGRGSSAQQFTFVTPGGIATWSGDKNAKVEQMGNMYLEGVQAHGTRTTITIPAGDIGNDRPINIVDEQWYSPDLQMTIMTKHSDPRTGETTFSLKNINRTSPPPTLFEVPSDYTVNAGGGRGGRSGGPAVPGSVIIQPRK
jgi:uncharacterized protein DUF6152